MRPEHCEQNDNHGSVTQLGEVAAKVVMCINCYHHHLPSPPERYVGSGWPRITANPFSDRSLAAAFAALVLTRPKRR